MRALAYLAFFSSGASSLIFQTLWTRMLHHTFGATSVAMSSVLTAFMAGLGLGAHVFGKRAASLRRPLLAYAFCELGVAVCALVIPWLVRSDGFLSEVNAQLRLSLGEDSVSFMLARFGCVFPLLIVPTTLMGASLPLLAQHFVRTDRRVEDTSAEVGSLYAVNTLGAVAGTLLGSFVLMPAIGVRATNWVAVGINAALGVVIIGATRFVQSGAIATAASAVRDELEPVQTPNWARRLAIWNFGISGACAMTYEVVWSRALSMAIGSSMQAFALILTTFLVGIASGSAVVSRLLEVPGFPTSSLATVVLCGAVLTALALAPAFALSSAALAATVGAVVTIALVVNALLAVNRARNMEGSDPELAEEAERIRVQPARLALLAPCIIALFELARFSMQRSSLPAVAVHGYLPHVIAVSVWCIAGFLWAALRLRAARWHLAGAIQLAIALSTLGSYVFQDEIPYGFARLVSSLGDPSEHVATVRFFMLFSAALCTLPATLGMGAMFPVTLGLWRRAGSEVGRDVGTVYASNTLGSILGSWLPGFVLLPRLGMELTLRLGMLSNALVALTMLLTANRIAVAERRVGRFLATLAVAAAGLLCALIAIPHTPLDWNLSHMTLGAFRVSLAREVLDPTSWGQPDLVYYRDGLSTTVSVERWGRHLSLKNNGKVDASNGDDMPTQIMVAAYPLLLHARGPRELEVAIVGFGSGVTVGAALEFPVKHIDAMELERAVVEASVDFFADVSHLPRRHAHFPYVEHPRLTLHSDDGRNFLAATPKRYDVIVSEPSNPWITGVSDLFTVDHFQITKQKLKPGGVYCQWVQLYEMSPENIKTIYRTFASQFRYVMAFAAEELSSDTILIGSDAPLPLDAAHVAASMQDPRVAAELERAYVHSPYDVWARMLFASRDEILRFSQRELRRDKRGKLAEVMRATGAEACQAPACKREPAPLNTDDNMLIELRAPSDLIGFSRYQGYLSLFYGPAWPYARLWPALRGLDTDADKVGMALSLIAHGREHEAKRWLDSVAAPDAAPLARDLQTARLLLGELPEPRLDFEPPSLGPQLDPAARRAFELGCAQIHQALQAGDAAAALRVFRGLPVTVRTLSGPSFRFLYAVVLLRSAGRERSVLKEAITELEDLIRKDETYTRAHPELYYFLARTQDEVASYDKAVRNMRAFVDRLTDD